MYGQKMRWIYQFPKFSVGQMSEILGLNVVPLGRPVILWAFSVLDSPHWGGASNKFYSNFTSFLFFLPIHNFSSSFPHR